MKEHELKTDKEVFEAVFNEFKNFEIRKNDRGFQVGDKLVLLETSYTGEEMSKGKPLEYTGRIVTAYVNYMLSGPKYGLMDGWCILDITPS